MLAMARSGDFAAGIELIVLALGGEKFVVGAAFDDTAAFKDDDTVAVADSREAVGKDKRRAALHQGVHTSLHEGFSASIYTTGCLVENEHGWIGYCRTSNG